MRLPYPIGVFFFSALHAAAVLFCDMHTALLIYSTQLPGYGCNYA